MEREKLRIGLLLEDYFVPSWTHRMIAQIEASEHSKVVLVVKKEVPQKKKESVVEKIWGNRKNLLYLLYTKFEDRFFKQLPNAFEPKDLRPIINCPVITVTPRSTRFVDTIGSQDLDKITPFQIDVFVRLGSRILHGGILQSAKYGVWSYHHGDNRVNRGGPPGTWEVLAGSDETGVMLQRLTEELDGGIKLFESFSATDKLSINRSRHGYYWKAASFLPRKLHQLFQDEDGFFRNVESLNSEPYFYDNRLFRAPGNMEMVKGVFSNYWKSVKRKVQRLLYAEQWILLYAFGEAGNPSRSFFKFHRIVPPKDRIYADPFPITKNNRHYIFFEEMLHDENKGKIAVIELDEKGNHGEPQLVLEKDYHLSYPLLFEENDVLYMIPESIADRTVQLYRNVEFPLKWELVKVMFDDVMMVDNTLFKHNGKYWMFANRRDNKETSIQDELFLFHTDSFPEGEWKPHPQNPIVSDVRCSRPAGNIFTHNGRIYRPAQNGGKHYGYGMEIREIVTLTEERYQERPVQSIKPNWSKDLVGTHTLNFHGRLTVIDGLIKKRR